MEGEKARFDGHCHLFNLWFLVEELAAVGWDAVWGRYPRSLAAGPLKAGPCGKQGSILDAARTVLRQIAQTGGALVNDYEGNYNLLQSNFRAVCGQDTELLAIPLMMDIYFMFAPSVAGRPLDLFPPKGPEAGGLATGGTATEGTAETLGPEAEFDRWFAKIKVMLLEELAANAPKTVSGPRGALASSETGLIQAELNRIYGNITSQASLLRGKAGKTVMTAGFEREIRDFLAFQARHRGTVFPFLAVDPRREGIMDLIRDGSAFGVNGPLVSAQGPFYGIKLYPRLGYLPGDIGSALFDWCAETDTPITAHTSPGGFPLWPGRWPWDDYGKPDNWRPLLARYAKESASGGLRLDFAHFGGEDEGWRNSITDIIEKTEVYGPNIRTDIACFTRKAELEAALGQLRNHPALDGRIIFGTDFDVMLLTDLIDIRTYLRQYFDVFGGGDPGSDQVLAMMGSIPRGFLKLPESIGVFREGPRPSPQRARVAFRDGLGKRFALGWLRDLPDVRDYTVLSDDISEKQRQLNVTRSIRTLAYPILSRMESGLPPRVDLRRWCSGVEDQKTLGSCTANAVVGLVEYFENRSAGKYIDASRLFLYKVTRKLLGFQGDSGAYLRTTLQAMVLFGVPPESHFPYLIENFDEEPAPFAYAFAQNYKTLSYYRLDPPGTPSEDLLRGIKTSLAAGLPSAFGFTVYDSLGEAQASGRVPFPSARDRSMGGHAVTAVGYDDDMEILNGDPGSLPTRGALLFRNSWGDWGEDGYGWLPYEYVLRGLAVDWWSIIKQDWVDTGAFD